ncbi:7386_t:CDS:2 [Cetraspora pellucida]|uniref:7386_t:CDS:1 n=1 Tax=Cetraspora pellucida TaxID=1433469 RepID=A0ACA9M4P2_9GLOM|nr:7386_t:CDS:2 [Cetraspora pellucida]
MSEEEDINTNEQVELEEIFSRNNVLPRNCNMTKEIEAKEELLQDDDNNITQEIRSEEPKFFFNKVANSDLFSEKIFPTWENFKPTSEMLLNNVASMSNCAAKFHICLIPFRWYYKDLDGSNEPFFTAKKFIKENSTTFQCELLVFINYLYVFQQAN